MVALVALTPQPAQADRFRDDQWHLKALRIAEAHAISQGQGVTIGVIDGGVLGTHPDLRGNILPGRDLIGGASPNGWTDLDGHGTGMAGLAVAHGHGSGDGALGIAPKAKVIPLRVTRDTGDPIERVSGKPSSWVTEPQMADGIDWLVAQGVKIISASLGSYDGEAVVAAVRRAQAKGVLVITSAGNSNQGMWGSGFGLSSDLIVGASNQRGALDPITVKPNPIVPITILAPGRDIVSTSQTGRYRIGTGTSPSVPIIAGTAALIWSRYPQLSAAEVKWRILSTATDVGPAGFDNQTGHGVVNPVAALAPDVPPSPGATPTAVANSCGPGLVPPSCLPAPPRKGQAAAADTSDPVPGWIILAALAGVSVCGALGALFARRSRRRKDA